VGWSAIAASYLPNIGADHLVFFAGSSIVHSGTEASSVEGEKLGGGANLTLPGPLRLSAQRDLSIIG
jgi:hypothetical protein